MPRKRAPPKKGGLIRYHHAEERLDLAVDERDRDKQQRYLFGALLLRWAGRINESRNAHRRRGKAKFAAIDDCWATIGSTNTMFRSFKGDTELNVSFWDEALVRKLRVDLLLEANLALPRPVGQQLQDRCNGLADIADFFVDPHISQTQGIVLRLGVGEHTVE